MLFQYAKDALNSAPYAQIDPVELFSFFIEWLVAVSTFYKVNGAAREGALGYDSVLNMPRCQPRTMSLALVGAIPHRRVFHYH